MLQLEFDQPRAHRRFVAAHTYELALDTSSLGSEMDNGARSGEENESAAHPEDQTGSIDENDARSSDKDVDDGYDADEEDNAD